MQATPRTDQPPLPRTLARLQQLAAHVFHHRWQLSGGCSSSRQQATLHHAISHAWQRLCCLRHRRCRNLSGDSSGVANTLGELLPGRHQHLRQRQQWCSAVQGVGD